MHVFKFLPCGMFTGKEGRCLQTSREKCLFWFIVIKYIQSNIQGPRIVCIETTQMADPTSIRLSWFLFCSKDIIKKERLAGLDNSQIFVLPLRNLTHFSHLSEARKGSKKLHRSKDEFQCQSNPEITNTCTKGIQTENLEM